MAGALRVRVGRLTVKVPAFLWKRVVEREARKITAQLGGLTAEHVSVRSFLVQEIAERAEPVSAQHIADRLQLPLPRVQTILQQLETHKLFLARNDAGAVSWAYPVTADVTPHRLELSSGELLYAA